MFVNLGASISWYSRLQNVINETHKRVIITYDSDQEVPKGKNGGQMPTVT